MRNLLDREQAVKIHDKSAGIELKGNIEIPSGAQGIILFAHGSGSSRNSPRNKFVAQQLRHAGLGTLLMDLLTEEEERADMMTADLRFNIPLLAERLELATDWIRGLRKTAKMKIGYFGASTGAAAAIVAAANRPDDISAVVSRGGRPDLAGDALGEIRCPTLLIVGGNDLEVLYLNRQALGRMKGEHELVVIPGATHLFEEQGTLEEVAEHAAEWFKAHIGAGRNRIYFKEGF